MDSYQFTTTQDWFSHNIESWTALFPLVKSNHPRVLEIGSWEGRSAVFLLDNLCKNGGEMVCIDHFDLFQTEAGRQRFTKIKHNLALTGKRFRILPQFSIPALMKLLTEETTSTTPGFDWIYVDGSHEAADAMLDGELAWRLAKKHAIIVFDDYHWDNEPEDSMHHPKRGIDAFMATHLGEFERVSGPDDYQVVLQKITDMRIGFLEGEVGPVEDVDKVFGYGINVVLTVDSAYAIGAAATIRSIRDNTPERITIYIVDCGLSSSDKNKLEDTVDGGKSGDITMVFVELPSGSLTRRMGPEWAKLDMLDMLPVERVLYLDADTLVRRNLKALWDTDLRGKAIGATVDVGHPMGHADIPRRAYFNAGVLLLDFAMIRSNVQELRALADGLQSSKFRDQDALNAHFADNWTDFGLEWNAQGLGTYARYPSAEREPLAAALAKMEDPNIVHFTGPVHPPLIEVLNPYVQPTTAKPWGYLGAPGHPHEAEWWSVLEKTPWKGFRTSAERQLTNEEKIENAAAEGTRVFRDVVKRRLESQT